MICHVTSAVFLFNCAGLPLYRHAKGTVETPARAVELSEDMYVYL